MCLRSVQALECGESVCRAHNSRVQVNARDWSGVFGAKTRPNNDIFVYLAPIHPSAALKRLGDGRLRSVSLSPGECAYALLQTTC